MIPHSGRSLATGGAEQPPIARSHPIAPTGERSVGPPTARRDHGERQMSDRFAQVFADELGRAPACPTRWANAGIASVPDPGIHHSTVKPSVCHCGPTTRSASRPTIHP